jgi:hypothetical protein
VQRRGRGGAIVAVTGLLGILAIAGVAFFVISQSSESAEVKHHSAEPTETSSTSGHHKRPGATQPQGRAAAYDNPLYKVRKRPGVPCRAPRLNTHSETSMNRFLRKVSDCLDESWARQFKAANIPFSPPTRVYWTQPGTSPCGSYPAPGAAAFYCSSNHAMYIGLKDVVKNSGDAPGSYYSIYLSVLAHEYGHHVQQSAGILQYGQKAETASGNTAGRNQMSRRIELQANCFDGVYLNSVGATLPMTSVQKRLVMIDAYNRGDRPPYPPDHGSRKHFRGWLVRGLVSGRPAMCNTWSASSSSVS